MSLDVPPTASRGACLVLLLLASACSAPAPADRSSTPIATTLTRPADAGSERFDAVIRPRRSLDFGFKTGGRLAEVKVVLGQKVRAGQVLAVLDMSAARAAEDQASGELVAARATSRQADDAAERVHGLDRVGALSQAEVSERVQAAVGARARLAAAEALVRGARVGIADSRIVAPEDGVVTAIIAEPGQVVGAGTAIVRLATGAPEAQIDVPEGMALTPGSFAQVTLWDSPAPVAARLRAVDPAGDERTRMRKAYFTLDPASPVASFNGSARLSLAGSTVSASVSVPLTALRTRGATTEVLVVSPDRHHVSAMPVVVNQLRGLDAVVTGLASGREIVADGLDALHDGEPVTVVERRNAGV